mmetsp:Transcript_42886/g.82134  ORF Transcript_42886/g.82134 Transcript_42886/m.82134 type:complete len:127 (-) Transcript_42886:104-484(-)
MEQTVGEELAQRLARKLQAKPGHHPNGGFGYVHRDYCGDTVFFQDGRFSIAPLEVDGYPPREGTAYISFDSEASFVEWLAAQGDATLTGEHEGPLKKSGTMIGNQTLSIDRIRDYVEEAGLYAPRQ